MHAPKIAAVSRQSLIVMSSFEMLVSFKCAAKIYFKGGESQHPVKRSCQFSLGTVYSEPHIQIEGQGFSCPKIRVKVSQFGRSL